MYAIQLWKRSRLTTMQCVARKVPELCKAYTPGKTDQDLNFRLSRLEHIIEMALPQFCSPGPSSTSPEAAISNGLQRSVSPGEDDTRSQTEEQEPSGGTFQSGKWYGSSASGSVAPAAVIERVCMHTNYSLRYPNCCCHSCKTSACHQLGQLNRELLTAPCMIPEILT